MGYGKTNQKIVEEIKSRKSNKKVDIIDKGIEVLADKTKDEITGEQDKVFKYINMFKTYFPLIMEGIKGFTDNKNAHQQQLQMQQQNYLQNQVRPPPYNYDLWRSMNTMQRLAYKYDTSRFNYDECVMYDQYLNNFKTMNTIQPVNPNQYQYMQQTQQPLRYEQPIQQKETLQSLAKRYPEPPIINDAQQNENKGDVINENIREIEKPIEEDTKQRKLIETEESNPKTEETINKEQEEGALKMIEENLIQENQKWLDMIIKFLNNSEMEKFKEYIKDIDNLIYKAKDYFWIIPFGVKTMFKNIPTERWVEEFKTQCPEKYQYLQESNQLEKVTEMFDKLKSEL